MTPAIKKSAPIHPGEYIEIDVLQRLNYSQSELAHKLGVSRQTISQLVNKQRLLSQSMATRLASVIGKTPDFWLNLSKEYEAWEYSETKHTVQAPKPNIKNFIESHANGGILIDREILYVINSNYLKLTPFNEDHLQPASIDLSIGKEATIRDVNGNEKKTSFNDELVIPPNTRAKVTTLEKIELPNRMTARIGATTQLFNDSVRLDYGAQIDPGYKGHLYVYISNWGNKDVTLGTGWPFITLEFNFLSETPSFPYDNKNPKLTLEDRPKIEKNDELASTLQALLNLKNSNDKEISKAASVLLTKIKMAL